MIYLVFTFGAFCAHSSVESIDENDGIHATIYELSGTRDDLHTMVQSYVEEIKRECHNVGGDDGFYDYFPTYMYMFYCMCRELNLRVLYDRTIDYVLMNENSQYFETDDDAIENMWRD